MKLTKTIAVLLGVTVAVAAGMSSVAGAQAKKTQKKTTAPAATSKADIEAGSKVYKANGCAACHAIGEAGGKTGPELTHVGKTGKADKLSAYVRNPKKSNPDAKMPEYDSTKISDKELKSLAAYLMSLK